MSTKLQFGLSRAVCLAVLFLTFTGCSHSSRGLDEYSYFGGSEGETKLEIERSIREHYDAGQVDSALIVLREHVETVGPRDFQYRTRLLLEIANGTFSEAAYDRRLIDNILRYQADQKPRQATYYSWGPVVDRSLEPFSMRVAAEQAPKHEPGSIERLLCDCFSGPCDSLFLLLGMPQYRNTELSIYRESEIRQIRANRLDGHFAFYSGMWWPSTGSKQLGNHPILGTVMGGSAYGFIYNYALEGRFLDAPGSYTLKRGDNIDTTDSFIGWYTGFEFGRDLVRTGHHDLFSRVGAGIDGFAYSDPKGSKVKRKLNSFNFNVGLGYRYHLRNYGLNYVGLEGVYNMPFYDRRTGDHLDGGMFSLRVLVGWYGNLGQGQRERTLLGRS